MPLSNKTTSIQPTPERSRPSPTREKLDKMTMYGLVERRSVVAAYALVDRANREEARKLAALQAAAMKAEVEAEPMSPQEALVAETATMELNAAEIRKRIEGIHRNA
ncbi:MAG TPA: hypothetical protein VLF40_01780 [Candidatus Saccharimonadales bacterium]|nr:hypothetical protein [Candidatus Saccharimonadales bacterium]